METRVLPTFSDRLGAVIIDGFVLSPLAVAVVVTGGHAAVRVGTIAVALAYSVVLHGRCGQTVGKRLVGTRVVRFADRGPISYGTAALRYAALDGPMLIAPVLPFVSAMWAVAVIVTILRPPLHRGIHDRLADTIVVVDDE